MLQLKVFLGGTCGNNRWREEIVIPGLLSRGVPEKRFFNPVVSHWSKEAQTREDREKRTSRYLLFVIASPDPAGSTANVSAYSLVELLMGLYDDPDRTVALFDPKGMPGHTVKAIEKAVKDIRQRFPQSPIFTDYSELMDWLAEHLLAEQR